MFFIFLRNVIDRLLFMKNKILVLGAGRSSGLLIKYLLKQSESHHWQVFIADAQPELALEKLQNHPNGRVVAFDIANAADQIKDYGLVVSMLPPDYHLPVAKACLQHGINLLTASYASSALQQLHNAAQQSGVLILMECGLDPGIDHMSAMEMIDEIHAEGGTVVSFKSYCGGLVAPESDDNPWGYKISWNPRNVVLAGQGGTVKYLQDGQTKFINYRKLFERVETVPVEGWGHFEAYANRDSLAYKEVYGLHHCQTLLRGTLRKPGYCKAWNVLVQLGLTDDSFLLENTEEMTYAQLLASFLPTEKDKSLLQNLCKEVGLTDGDSAIEKIQWLGLLEGRKIGVPNVSPAGALQRLMEEKWKLAANDKDMVVMKHELAYLQQGEIKRRGSSLVVLGDNNKETAMAKTVGLPLGIAAKLVLTGQVKAKGVQIPVIKELYKPILEELTTYGVVFREGV